LIIYRIAMLFTALRKYENGDLTHTLPCTDTDFAVALQLSEIYMQHSLLMFNNLPKREGGAVFTGGDYKQKFFEELPIQFTRAEALCLGTKFSMKKRTVDVFLTDAINANLLIKPRLGCFEKV
ncbi:MAG TPA: hypothetical protein VHA52_12190, partial [Candidatus Babeliaceae bacterium]|nr:hypothetical protein [Candidatus Babeliaceae bacterium]